MAVNAYSDYRNNMPILQIITFPFLYHLTYQYYLKDLVKDILELKSGNSQCIL